MAQTTGSTAANMASLNWKELDRWVSLARDRLEGRFVERVFIPERPKFPGGYLKAEWALRLQSRAGECVLAFSVRTRHPYIYFIDGNGPRAAAGSTQSPFGLALAKHLKGAKLKRIEALMRERVAVLWFTSEEESGSDLGLVLALIPSLPEALLVRAPARASAESGAAWPVIARSRTLDSAETLYSPPDGSRAPDELPVREELLLGPEDLGAAIESVLDREAFALRTSAAERELRERAKTASTRLKQARVALAEARSEPDWRRFGDLLKATLHSPPPARDGYRELEDFESGGTIRVPADPKLDPRGQVEKFYQLAKRKARRISEAETRISGLEETVARAQASLASMPREPGGGEAGWAKLEAMERELGIVPAGPAGAARPGGAKKRGPAWLGKSFVSRDGLQILVGRSRDENLELTFKHARGNDIWMHVRGRPGAHVVIPLPSGKSAPLETLLDAATLAVHYSGGERWGKTEVDYTFKKHVKRIRDSTEASYTHNKTLIVEPNRERLKRLLGP